MRNYIIKGSVYKHVGKNWKHSNFADWTKDKIDWTSVKYKGEIYPFAGTPYAVYGCRDCPHTFYASYPVEVMRAHGFLRDN
jgi:hypothetical protein